MHYLLSLFELHNESIKKQVGISKSATTYRKYETTRKHLQGYLRTKCLEDIILENINHALFVDLRFTYVLRRIVRIIQLLNYSFSNE